MNVRFLTIGKKGFDYLRKQKFNIAGENNDLLNDLTFERISVVAEKVMNSFVAGEFDRIEIIYNHFKNAAVQQLTREVFLPVESAPVDRKNISCLLTIFMNLTRRL